MTPEQQKWAEWAIQEMYATLEQIACCDGKDVNAVAQATLARSVMRQVMERQP